MTYAYALVTDTCADLPLAIVEAAKLEVLSFPYVVDGIEHHSHVGDPMASFYEAMRAGSAPSTASIPLGDYVACFRAHAEAGREVVLLAFSSGLSSSFESALMAREAVLAEYPGAAIRVVDTLRASIAQGALVAEAIRRRDAGATAEELEHWAVDARGRTTGFFTAETLEHLRRGGRVHDVTAAAGAMLDIKPMLTFDGEGGLKLDGIVRGRKRSIRALAEQAAKAPEGAELMLGHADSAEDAERLADAIAAARPDLRLVRCEIGPVIGTHTGPGMLAIAFVQ